MGLFDLGIWSMADKMFNDGFILHVFQTTGAVDERAPGAELSKSGG